MITAASSENLTADAFRMGACYYIVKPFSKEAVLDKVHRLKNYRNRASTLAGSRKVEPYMVSAEYERQNLESDVTQILPMRLGFRLILRDISTCGMRLFCQSVIKKCSVL